jgi:hypothetical protein
VLGSRSPSRATTDSFASRSADTREPIGTARTGGIREPIGTARTGGIREPIGTARTGGIRGASGNEETVTLAVWRDSSGAA